MNGLGQRGEHAGLVGGLVQHPTHHTGPPQCGGDLGGEQQDGRGRGSGLAERGQGVGGARPGRGERDTEPSAGPGQPVRGIHGRLFVAHPENPRYVRSGLPPEREVVYAGQPEHGVHAGAGHGFEDAPGENPVGCHGSIIVYSIVGFEVERQETASDR